MIVCICRRVSDRDIARAVRHGCQTFDALQDELGVATCCGACQQCAVDTFVEHASAAAAQCSSIAKAGPTLHAMLMPRRAEAQAAAA